MGKRIIQQRRGRGTSTYRVPHKSFRPIVEYKKEKGTVIDIVRAPLLDAPLAKIRYENGTSGFIVAPEGLMTGHDINDLIKPLSDIKEGTKIFCIETSPFSGPKLCRAPGSSATIVSKGNTIIVQLASKKKKALHPGCRATLGTAAGEGRRDKPFVKAGPKWHAMHARGKLYPRTSGKAMNAVDHPYGGSGHGSVRRPVSRHAPPGRKVGTVSPRRTGKKK